MLPVKTLLGIFTISLSLVVVRSDDTNTSTTFPLTKFVNITSGYGLVQSSQARAKHFSKGLQQSFDGKVPPSAPAENNIFAYLITVKVGIENPSCKPASKLSFYPSTEARRTIDQLIIDTGSSNTWVGKEYVTHPDLI